MINQDLVKKLRSERGWTQEHLALISGISLRTVQRVENEGRCSMDSKKSLAAAFDLDVVALGVKGVTIKLEANDPTGKAAISWLEIVDSGDYAASWQEADPLFQERISRKKWVKALDQVRKPLGKVVSRSIQRARQHDSLPGVPDGHYFVITFVTGYDRKQSSVETVTLNKTNKEWRVTGYFIK